MATSPDVTGRNDTTLWAAESMLADIADRAEGWSERPVDERADFQLEWEAIVRRVDDLADDDRVGRLTPEQCGRFAALGARLARARDLIMSLGLDYPKLDQLTRASRSAGRRP